MLIFEPELFICTYCLELTSKGEDSQICDCEVATKLSNLDCPSGFHLCYVCSIYPAGGFSRWSWEACETCLSANSFLKETTGRALKLGRHSIMNGLGFSLQTPKNLIPQMSQNLIEFSLQLLEVEKISRKRTREILNRNQIWKGINKIPLKLWIKRLGGDKEIHFYDSVKTIKEILDELEMKSSES